MVHINIKKMIEKNKLLKIVSSENGDSKIKIYQDVNIYLAWCRAETFYVLLGLFYIIRRIMF